jgi:hypothetical protein
LNYIRYISTIAGAGNVYSAAGMYTLVKHFHDKFGAAWQQEYLELVNFLDRKRVSLGFELVSRCLGEHGSLPNCDHLVLNVAMDRDSLAPYSPLLLVRLKERFLLEVNVIPTECFSESL